MNQRIRELAGQAFTAVGTTHDSITHRDLSVLDKNDTITAYTFTQNTMEKFAELIVRECCNMVNKHTQHNNPNDCLLVLDIKEHFGVEAKL